MRRDAEKSIPWTDIRKLFHPINSTGQKAGEGYPLKTFNVPVFLDCWYICENMLEKSKRQKNNCLFLRSSLIPTGLLIVHRKHRWMPFLFYL